MKRRRSSHLCARLVHGAASKSRHTPRMRGIQYAAASRFHDQRLWNTGSSAFADDDSRVCYIFEFQTALLCTNTASRSRRAFRASFASNPPSQIRGRRECRAPGAPAASRVEKNTRVSHHGHAGSPGIPCAMVLTVSFALSPVTGLVCHRHRRKYLHRLDASVGASGPHDFAVHVSAVRQRAAVSTASRAQRS
jgi:hypothetical protein